jgi:hypothetical protein
LDFRPGSLFEADVRRRFSSPVCSGSPNSLSAFWSAFWLVVSFGRCIFKLDPVSVGHLLQAAFGGFARGFKVLSLADRVFRFTVSSKDVGFHIYNSRCIVRPEFKAFFNLWNSGGPNWNYKFRLFLQEENANWWFVKGRKKISFADMVRRPPLTGANAVPILRHNLPSRFAGNLNASRISVFNRLGSSSGARGSRFPVTASSSGAPSRDLHRRLVPSVGLPRLNRSMIGRGRQGRDDCSFSISNSTAGLPRIRRLHWWPILRNGPLRPGPGLSGPPPLGGRICLVRFRQRFSASFVKPGGIWNCSAIVRNRILDFPSPRSLPSKVIAFWRGRLTSWTSGPGSALPPGP